MRIVYFILGLVIFPNWAWAVMVNPSIEVTSADVKISDIFLGSKNDTWVMAAPDPGKKVVLDKGQLRHLAMKNGIDWKPMSGHETVEVTRASRKIEDEEIVQAIESRLSDKFSGQSNIVMTFDKNRPDLFASQEFSDPLTVEDFKTKGHRFYAKIKADGPQVIQVSGRAEALLSVPVLNRTIGAGEVIQAHDIEYKEIAESEVVGRIVMDQEGLIGTSPRYKTLLSGEPIRGADIEKPMLVKRGSMVDMIYKRGSVEIAARGQAVENGGMGDMVRVTNPSSRKVVTGLITGHNQIEVGFTS